MKTTINYDKGINIIKMSSEENKNVLKYEELLESFDITTDDISPDKLISNVNKKLNDIGLYIRRLTDKTIRIVHKGYRKGNEKKNTAPAKETKAENNNDAITALTKDNERLFKQNEELKSTVDMLKNEVEGLLKQKNIYTSLIANYNSLLGIFN